MSVRKSQPPDLAAAMQVTEEYFGPTIRTGESSYLHTGNSHFEVRVVPIDEVKCFSRGPGVPGINRPRAFSILLAVETGVPLPPVNVYPLIPQQGDFKYELYHGYHRFHLSHALGYSHLPIAINFASEA